MFEIILATVLITTSVAFLGFLVRISVASLKHPNINSEW